MGATTVSYINSIKRGVCVLASIVFVAAAGATPVSWSNSSGSAANFTYSNGSNENGLAGDPVVGSDFLGFFPSGLKAIALNGASNSASETIHVTLTPNAGLRITNITVIFNGDESVLGTASTGYFVGASATNHGTSQQVMQTFTSQELTTSGTISYINPLPIPLNYGAIDLDLFTTIHATAGQDASALSEMKVIEFVVNTGPGQVVPLPAALATFPIGAALVGFATRRMKKRPA
jgi:hypothetical protein